jgi:hypothetical protein
MVLGSGSVPEVVNGKILKRASHFLRELSNDNQYCKGSLPQLTEFINSHALTCDNSDFFWNMVEFWLNINLDSLTP